MNKLMLKRGTNIFFASVFIVNSIFAMVIGFTANTKVSAAPVCTVDTQGANDQPGQKDLTQLCVDTIGMPNSLQITFSWDQTSWSGANTGDACVLFDTDGDGNANYATCVVVGGNPAAVLPGSPVFYSCNDTRSDRCVGSISTTLLSASCTVGIAPTDPFAAGTSYPNDTTADCVVNVSLLPSTTELLDTCSYPSSQPNSDPSDCVVYASNTGKLEVVKSLTTTTNDTFNLLINGTVYASSVVDGGTTGEHVVDVGSYTVSETSNPGSSLNNYSRSVVCKNLNGTGSIVAQNNSDGTVSVPVSDGSDIVCIITNTLQMAHLTVIKTVDNTAGGTLLPDDFNLSVNDTAVLSGTEYSFAPGVYTVSEVNQAGYTAGTWGGDCATNGIITLLANQSATCTITNTAIAPTVKLIKEVTNDNGGTLSAADFNLLLNGLAVTQNTSHALVAGNSYSVSETQKSGYLQESIICVDDQTGTHMSNPFTPSLAQSVTCTVKNNDIAPTLLLEKNILNPEIGGSMTAADFILTANGQEYTTGQYVQNVVAETEYIIGEQSVQGYRQVSINCIDVDTMQPISHPVTLSLGQNVKCVVNNEVIAPTITYIKEVENNWGGNLQPGDFVLYMDGNTVVSGQSNTTVEGAHTFTEDDIKGYVFALFSGDCAGTGVIDAHIGQSYVCIIRNQDVPATISVEKKVVNDNGGTLEPADFNLYLNSTDETFPVENNESIQVRVDSVYSVSEDEIQGYEQENITCIDNMTLEVLSVPFAPELGQSIHCTITNNDIPQKTTITKVIDGDESQSFEFVIEYSFGGLPVSENVMLGHLDSVTVVADANTPIYVTEAGMDGWKSVVSCDYTESTIIANMVTVTQGLAENSNCYFYNIQQALLHVVKFEDKNANGVKDVDETTLSGWEMTVKGLEGYTSLLVDAKQNTDSTGMATFAILDEFLLSEEGHVGLYVNETQQTGWVQTGRYCETGIEIEELGVYSSADDLVVTPGSIATCYIGNKKLSQPRVLSETTEVVLVNTGQNTRYIVIAAFFVLAFVAFGYRTTTDKQ